MPRLELRSVGVEVTTPEGGTRTLLHPTSLTLEEQRIGVIGPNGTGKSTLVRLLNGLVTPSTGSVHVGEVDVTRSPAAARRLVGFSFTDPAAQLVMPTCVEDVELSLRRHEKDADKRRARALDVLAAYGLGAQADQSVHTLSGGQKQLLALAGVLAVEPQLLVCDEPTTLLDLANTRRIAALLFSLEQQLVLVTHDLDLARRCERVLVVDDARVVFDGPAAEAVEHYVASVS